MVGSVPPELIQRLRGTPGVEVRDGRVLRVPPDLHALLRKQGFNFPTWKIPVAGGLAELHEHLGRLRGGRDAFPWQGGLALALSSGRKRIGNHATGLGKTGAGHLALELVDSRRALVVTKSAGRESWVRDSARFGSHRVGVLCGESDCDSSKSAARRLNKYLEVYRDRGAKGCLASNNLEELFTENCDVIVAAWETLSARRWELDDANFDRLVLDESHKGKGWGGKVARSAAALHLAKSIGEGNVWALSATPVPDRLRDLHYQLAYISLRAWERDGYKFLTRYCHAQLDEWEHLNTKGCEDREGGPEACAYCREAREELRARFRFWADTRTRDELRSVLPRMTRNVVLIPLSDDEKDEAVATVAAARDVEDAVSRAAERKTPWVSEAAAETLIAGGKVVVAGNRRAWAPRMMNAILRKLPARIAREKLWSRIVLGGDPAYSAATADEYMHKRGPALIVGTMQALYESMDLQDTDRAIAAALPQTPNEVIQFEGRFQRPQQQRTVVIDYPVAQGTIDEPIRHSTLEKFKAVEGVGASTEGEDSFVEKPPSESQVLKGLRGWLDRAIGAGGSGASGVSFFD